MESQQINIMNSFSNKDIKESNNLLNSNEKKEDRIYFILCYHKIFLDNIQNIYSKNQNNEIKIELQYKNSLNNKPDYFYAIYSCIFNKGNKLPKKLDLVFVIKNKNNLLKEIDIKPEKTKFYFDKLIFDNPFLLIQLLDNEKAIPPLRSHNYYYSLTIDEIFSFYFEYLYEKNNNDTNYLVEYSKYLINNYFTIIKNKKNLEESRNLSSLIK